MAEAGLDRAAVERLHGKYGSLATPAAHNRPIPVLGDVESNYPWLLVMLHQFLREAGYYILAVIWAMRSLCRPRRVAPELTDGPSQPSSSTKTILFIRHGQGNHNKSVKGWKLIDPPLNESGIAQAKSLHTDLGGVHGVLRSVEAVIVSPLARAIQTAQGAFGHGPAFGNCTPPIRTHWVVTPLLRERMGAPCDEGRPKSELLAAMPEMADWEGVDDLAEHWWPTGFEWDLYDRIAELEAYIRSRPESTIALVGHGGLFTRILGYHLKNCGHQWAAWEADAPIAV
mmetsp:Transcript_33317/g.106287  ORF Transcript_33317/g.106287 Transcript_33317/m.106287 type:complete len:285 (-) Transcript_33317:83-937(-)